MTRGAPGQLLRRPRFGALTLIIFLLSTSGLIRLGEGAGRAYARAAEAMPEVASEDACATDPGLMPMLQSLREREAQLDAREARLEDRAAAMRLAQEQLDQKIAALIEAENDLARTVAVADQAAEADVARLVTLYESMKPKEAAPVFEAMAPDFAAGFLARMRPDSAAQVLAGLKPETAYAISLLMAGRNANAPKK